MIKKTSHKPAARGATDAAPRARLPRTSSTRPVGSFVPLLTRKAFEKYGFSSAALLTDWAAIVGSDLASYTQPERLKWSRHVQPYGEVERGAEGRPGATLVLRVDGPRAIELHYKSRHILERVNAYFGYRAVTEMRFVQAPIEERRLQTTPFPPAAASVRPSPSRDLDAVSDHALRSALARLQANVSAEGLRRATPARPADRAIAAGDNRERHPVVIEGGSALMHA